MSEIELVKSSVLAVFILDGKEHTFGQAFKKLLGKDKNVPQSRGDI